MSLEKNRINIINHNCLNNSLLCETNDWPIIAEKLHGYMETRLYEIFYIIVNDNNDFYTEWIK